MNQMPQGIKLPGYFRWIKVITLTISAIITLAVLITFWTWLGPATFWQRIAGFLLSIGGGIVLFGITQMLLMMLIGALLSRYIQKQMVDQFQGFQKGMDFPMEPEGEEEETAEQPMDKEDSEQDEKDDMTYS